MGHRRSPTAHLRSTARKIVSRQSDGLTVEIGDVEETANSVSVTVYVSTESTDTIEYELEINDTATGTRVERSGTLLGGSGSFPGDVVTHETTFDVDGEGGGTITAVITAPDEFVGSEYQDQVSWGDSDSIEPEFEVTQCDVSTESDGSLTIDYTIAPSNDTGGTTDVEFRVDGETVGGEFHDVPARGEGYSKTIPPEDLPIGEEMPVEVGISGNFSDCGTVTVEEEDAGGGFYEGEISGPATREATVGEETSIEFTVEKTHDQGIAQYTFFVYVDGERIGQSSQGFQPFQKKDISVSYEPDEPGTFPVEIGVVAGLDESEPSDPDTVSAGEIVVAPTFDPDKVEPTCPDLPGVVVVGQEFTLDWTIENGNDGRAAVDYEVRVGGDVVDSGSETVYSTRGVESAAVIESIDDSEAELEVETLLTDVSEA